MPSAGGSDTKRASQVGRDEHVWKSDPYDRAKNDRLPIRWNEDAIFDRIATGACIQLLLTMIQKALNVVPSATIAVENK